MSRIDALPADQGAVLQLLLRQGKDYRQLGELLDLDESEVRGRAHGALAALGPDAAPGLDDARRAEVGDWLLGQQDEAQGTATRAFLEGSAGGRAWARVVADELRDLAGDRVPEIPDEGRDDGAAAATAATTPAASGATTPAATETPDTAADGFGARDAPRSSRLGGALLLGGLAIVAVAVVLFFVLRDGGDDDPAPAPAASTTAAQPQAKVEAQVNLVPPDSRKNLKALGVVLVQRAQNQDQIVAAVQGLPKPKSGGYGIWLYSGPGKAQWLGFFASQDDQGRLLARGQLKTPIAGYREVLVTREAKGNPDRPGSIYLRGPIKTASDTSGG